MSLLLVPSRSSWCPLVIAALLQLSCSAGDGGDGQQGGDGQLGADGVGARNPGDDLSLDGSGTPDSDGPGGGDKQTGCQKVDFLFAIDNSGSMQPKQQRLVEVFPGFLDSIRSTLPTNDYRIMVVDSDSGELGDACDRTLGAGIVHPRGENSSDRDCEFDSGGRYMTSDSDQLQSQFTCAAQVGTEGSGIEKPFSSLAAAVTASSPAGVCNGEFLREDAILVITVITDDYPIDGYDGEDATTNGTAQQWYDAVVEAKSGDPSAVVVIGFVPPQQGLFEQEGCPVPDWQKDLAHPPEKFHDFISSFGEQGVTAPVCDFDAYDATFEAAVSKIDSTCRAFVPPVVK